MSCHLPKVLLLTTRDGGRHSQIIPRLSICLSIYPSLHLSACLNAGESLRLNAAPPFLAVHLHPRLAACRTDRLSTDLSTWWPAYLADCLPAFMSVCLCWTFLPFHVLVSVTASLTEFLYVAARIWLGYNCCIVHKDEIDSTIRMKILGRKRNGQLLILKTVVSWISLVAWTSGGERPTKNNVFTLASSCISSFFSGSVRNQLPFWNQNCGKKWKSVATFTLYIFFVVQGPALNSQCVSSESI